MGMMGIKSVSSSDLKKKFLVQHNSISFLSQIDMNSQSITEKVSRQK